MGTIKPPPGISPLVSLIEAIVDAEAIGEAEEVVGIGVAEEGPISKRGVEAVAIGRPGLSAKAPSTRLFTSKWFHV
jgi:hypothetical protein